MRRETELFVGSMIADDRSALELALVFLRLGVYLDPGADVISLALGQLLRRATGILRAQT